MKNKDYVIKFCNSKTTYTIKQRSDNVLQHWEKEDHKYVAKVEKPDGRYRYFYSEEEYKRYLENQKEKPESENIFDKIGSIFENVVAKPISEVTKYLTDSINNGLEFVKKQASKALSDLDYATRSFRFKLEQTARRAMYGEKGIKKTSSARDWNKYVEKVILPNGKTRYFYDIKSYVNYINRQRYQKNEPEFMKKVPDQDYSDIDPYFNATYAEGSPSEFFKINDKWLESYDNGDKKYTNNCQLCTVAYELVQRGYDVQAGYMDLNDPDRLKLATPEGLEYAFENPVTISYKEKAKEKNEKIGPFTTPNLEEFIKENCPSNSRGNLQVRWLSSGSGHSLIYEVDVDGNVQIKDAQVGQTYSKPEQIAELADRIEADHLNIIRTDNLKLKEGVLDFVEY